MGLQVEIWKRQIIIALRADNAFLATGTDVTSEVLNGAVVHIPNAGQAAGVQRNRQVLPAAAVVQRADNDVSYVLDTFTSDPMLVTEIEQADISYNKMASMIEDNGALMMEVSGSAIIEYWARNVPTTGGYRILTTGAGRLETGLTGARKKMTAADLRSAATKMNNDNVPKKDRYIILTPNQIQDLMEDADIKNTFTFTAVDYAKGELPMYAGFKILERSAVVRLETGGNTRLPDPNTAVLPTDNFAGIAYQKQAVEFALGTVGLFTKIGDPEMYGDVMSMLIRAAGRARRFDKKGVVLLVQAP